ncbi:uncharacterized protein [Primulina huaijiensis]|uniref:uncharacterized protein n=1 Tax=Primulina huaijiensis TaxID=1492673 RepID=UPI003CC71B39
MNWKAFYKAIKSYNRRSSGFRSRSTINLVVPPTGCTSSDQQDLQFIRIFYWAFGVASISYCVNHRLATETLAKESRLDAEKYARVMSHGDTSGAATRRDCS